MTDAFSSLHKAQFDLATAEAKLVRAQGSKKYGARMLMEQAVDDLALVIADANEAKRALERELWGRPQRQTNAAKG